jgi:long-subunit fatty acid transport protein
LRIPTKCLSAAALLTLAAQAALAQDQQLGARTKAMGGSYTAFEDDPVSVWLNPAGIATQPDQMSIVYQTYTAYPRGRERGAGDTINFTVEPESVQSDPAFLPSYIGFVFSLAPDMAVGFCYAQPYLLQYSLDQVTNPIQTAFIPEAEVQQSLSRFRVAFAKDFAFREADEAGFFTHLSVGLALDIGYERWEFSSPTENEQDTTSAPAGGFGLLLGLYDDKESLRINLGVAYQSAVHYEFEIEPDILPAFDMPQQLNAGLTLYVFQGFPLRVTLDLQWIEWSETAEDPIFPGFDGFEDAVNVSMGFEYRVKLDEAGTVSLYPRAGIRQFDAPWEDKDALPMTGGYRLVLDTDDEAFTIFTYGFGLQWRTAAGKLRSLDVAGDAGGDAFNLALGFNYEF